MNYKISDKWFYFPVIILLVYFIFRLINQSQMINMFPLDYTNDVSAYMAMLFFLVKYGFHNISPYWYNGYPVLLTFPPGWFFFTLPLYYLFKDVKAAAFISLILMYIISFIIIYFIGKVGRISKTKRIIFFLFLFANPIAVGNFIRAGRYVELFGWVSFLLSALIIFYYKDRKLDKGFLWFIPSYALLLMGHSCVAIPSHFLILSLLLIKKWKEKLLIILSLAGGIIISSFWLIPFLKNIFNTITLSGLSQFITEIKPPAFSKFFLSNIAGFIIIFALWFIFYYYWLSKDKSKKELIFFSPILILSILFFTRLIIYIPFLKSVFPDVYLIFFIFFISFYFLCIKQYTIFLKRVVILALIIVPIISVGISATHTPFFTKHTELERNTIDLFDTVDGKFIIVGGTKTSYAMAYYSFAPIYYNLSTADGWSWTELNKDYFELLRNNQLSLKNKDCGNFINSSKILNVSNVIGYGEYCDKLNYCNLNNIIKKDGVCLYKLK